eukprot:TRINITY_DN18151_c0_g1_i4.p1 TRINITY_DN18151_c0_g1~~TRINITY_DN18151_c0_g1_i4.p1  ORF type:complete len:156 (+),score=34.40 TRINITY_DN18151_c0_g1_i4:89-556(+)
MGSGVSGSRGNSESTVITPVEVKKGRLSHGSDLSLSPSSLSTGSQFTTVPTPEEAATLARQVAEGEASEDSLDLAAELLILSGPPQADPEGFGIPEPSWWNDASKESSSGKERRGGRGVPLRLVASRAEVAWEVDGKLQTLIGAAKRTGDHNDVW